MATKSEVQEMKSMFEVLMIKIAEMSTEMQTMKQNQAGSTSAPHIASAINLNAVPLQTPLVPVLKEQTLIQQKACPKYDSENEGSWYGGSSDESEDEVPKEDDAEIVHDKTRRSKAQDKHGKSAREKEYERKMADMEMA